MPDPLPDGTAPSDAFPMPVASIRHPTGLWVLVTTEAGLAFSLYGFESLLVLYLVSYLLHPNVADHVWGMGLFLPLIRSLYGAASPSAIAAAITGLFLSLIYATPLLGGFMADWRLGRIRTVIIGGTLLVAGLLGLAVDQTFLLGLLLLLVGLGCTRGILPAQVGALYPGNDPRRADAYQLFVLGIQGAAILSPALCGTVATRYGWHAGFLTSGIGMFIGLNVYLFGCRFLPRDQPMHLRPASVPFTPSDRKSLLALGVLLPVLAIATLSNTDIFNGYLLWGDQAYQLEILGFRMPTSWLVSLDGFVSTFTVLGIVWFWRAWNRRRPDPGEMPKILIGSTVCSLAPLLLALGSWLQPGLHSVSLLWGIGFHLVNDVGFGLCYATGMALFSRVAPAAISATVVASYSLHLFVGNLVAGKVAGLVTKMPWTRFWLLHVALGIAGTIALFAISRIFRQQFTRDESA